MPTATQSLEAAATACARAEHAKWVAVLAEHDRQIAEIESDRSVMYSRMAHNAIVLDIAVRLALSERQVWRIVDDGSTLRDQAPHAWTAFGFGQLCAQKASIIALAVARTTCPETAAAVDRAAVSYAREHTPAELRRWLSKLIDRLEPLDLDEAETERADRHVSVDHTTQGMSWLNAYIPSTAAVAIENRLKKAARALTTTPAGDRDARTRAQKEADLFVSWLTNATGTESDVKAEIAVLIEAEALAGVTNTPIRVDDDGAIAPVEWIAELAAAESTVWTRLLTDPAGHVLDVTHIGYQPPEALRHAIRWRDMRCRVAGCGRRAEFTDLDHRDPFGSGGPTNGSNLWCLCRKHHGIKGHGLLPPSAHAPPETHLVRLPSPPLLIEYVAA